MTILSEIDRAYRESRTFWGATDSCWDDAHAAAHAAAIEAEEYISVTRVYNIIRAVVQDEPDASSTRIAAEVALHLGLVTADEASDYAGVEMAA